MRFTTLNTVLPAATVGFMLAAAAPATAEVSSVDAYSGQAAVLGAPRAHHNEARGANVGSGGRAGVGTHTGVAGSSSQGPPSSSGGAGSLRGGGAASKGTAVGQRGPASAGPSQPAGLANEGDGSLPLSGLDVFVLVAIFACLLGAGVLMRRLGRRQPE